MFVFSSTLCVDVGVFTWASHMERMIDWAHLVPKRSIWRLVRASEYAEYVVICLLLSSRTFSFILGHKATSLLEFASRGASFSSSCVVMVWGV